MKIKFSFTDLLYRFQEIIWTEQHGLLIQA